MSALDDILAGSPFTATYIDPNTGVAPVDCPLPPISETFTPPVFSFPDLPAECNFNPRDPVIVPPYYCTPTVSGTVNYETCPVTCTGGEVAVVCGFSDSCPGGGTSCGCGGSATSVAGSATGTVCDYEISGTVYICQTCVNPSGGGGISAIDSPCGKDNASVSGTTATLPKPECFDCNTATAGTTNFISLDELTIGQSGINWATPSPCCDNSNAAWKDCGSTLTVAPAYTAAPTSTFSVKADSSTDNQLLASINKNSASSLKLSANTGSYDEHFNIVVNSSDSTARWQVDMNSTDLNTALTAYSTPPTKSDQFAFKFQVINVCSGGDAMYMGIIATDAFS